MLSESNENMRLLLSCASIEAALHCTALCVGEMRKEGRRSRRWKRVEEFEREFVNWTSVCPDVVSLACLGEVSVCGVSHAIILRGWRDIT
jgi:hypothetical protein